MLNLCVCVGLFVWFKDTFKKLFIYICPVGFASSVSPNQCSFLDSTVKFHCQTTLNSSSGPVLLLLLEQNYSYKCSLAFSSQNKPVLPKVFQYSVSASWFIWSEVKQRVTTLYTWLADLQMQLSQVLLCSWHWASNNTIFSQYSWSRKGACL